MKVFSVLLLFMFHSLHAQQETGQQERATVFDVDAQQIEKSNEQILPQQQFLEQAFEKEIDPTQYILGPGDQLLIKIWGVLENQFPAIVSPEGFVIIPSVAEIFVSGKTLQASAIEIKAALEKTFKKAAFSIRLIKMRKFRVFVVGEVSAPGTYFLRAVDRVSDAIQLAGGLVGWGDDTRIQVTRLSGTVDTVNINEFFLTGSLEHNSLIKGGDIIYVPPIDLRKNYVIIEGNVGSQGIYQTRPNETIFEFLTRLRAINRSSDIENIILIRGEQKQVYNLLKSETGARTEVLQTGDRIMIPTNRNRVYVRGEVFQPGPQPYLANYLAKDYAGFAGALETAKDFNSLFVIRAKNGKIEKGSNVVVESGDVVVVPRRGREKFKDILAILTPIISVGISAAALIIAAK